MLNKYMIIKPIVITLILIAALKSSVIEWNHVPTESMLPAIRAGDHIVVNKAAYNIKLPFTRYSLVHISDPQRNDIIVFESSILNKKMVKRVVAMPGDMVCMDKNVLRINGQEVEHLTSGRADGVIKEKHNDYVRHVIFASDKYSKQIVQIKVPDHHYLVLGDNRNNSVDSRYIGFVPRNEIVGRVTNLLLSAEYKRQNHNNHAKTLAKETQMQKQAELAHGEPSEVNIFNWWVVEKCISSSLRSRRTSNLIKDINKSFLY